MAYEPPSGWVQVTRIKSTGEIFHQRLHGDRTCAEASVRDRIAAEAAKGRDVESYLSDHMTYAQARRLEKFSCCKCSGRPAREIPISAATWAAGRPASTRCTTNDVTTGSVAVSSKP